MESKSITTSLSLFIPVLAREQEAWVVNTVKVKMIMKLDKLLESPGKMNARKLFLVPVFTIDELRERVESQAPELTTFYFRQLHETIIDAEKTFS